ncbi:MAG TPA: GIY-YIG nuclease family protein, partial [Tahibacter sp.]|uniref:GIY-YIG nuclease family protein n=1 Tax=Tahibacter sp. TaxID=2056211 RepID=UPI002D0707E4
MDFEPPYPFTSTSSVARAYLYVLPCQGEDWLKLGFSRDPLARMQQLHPRFFEFFDTDLAFAVETETVRDARALETRFGRALRTHAAPAPLTVSPAAGGSTEWYRGAYAHLAAAADALGLEGYPLHRPLRPWMTARLEAGAELLYAWTALLSPDELGARGAASRATVAQRRVADVLDAYRAAGIGLAHRLPAG